ncbi:hypothetical protein D918_01977 [Trichuris suis]|nr:hypothetical protein D918_01977 [Trichuris suis]
MEARQSCGCQIFPNCQLLHGRKPLLPLQSNPALAQPLAGQLPQMLPLPGCHRTTVMRLALQQTLKLSRINELLCIPFCEGMYKLFSCEINGKVVLRMKFHLFKATRVQVINEFIDKSGAKPR